MVTNQYGVWTYIRIVLGTSLGLFVGFGATFSANSAIFDPTLANFFGWTRTTGALSYSAGALGIALFSPLIGRLVDRYGSRRVIFIFIWMYSLSVALMSLQNGQIWLWITLSFIVGITGSATSAMGYLVLLPQWFDKHLGLALAISMLGAASGMVIIPIITQYIIVLWGWKIAYQCIAVLILIGSLIALLLLKEKPAHKQAHQTLPPAQGLTLQEVFHNYRFWLLIIIFFLLALCTLSIIPHIVNMYKDKGLDLFHAARGAAMLGVGVFLGRLLIALCLDKLHASFAMAFFLGIASMGLFILNFSNHYVYLLVASLFIGLAMGAEGDLLPYLVKSYFGLKALGRIMGMIFGMFCLGAILGPIIMGLLFEYAHAYTMPLKLASITLAILAALSLSLGKYYHSTNHVTPSHE